MMSTYIANRNFCDFYQIKNAGSKNSLRTRHSRGVSSYDLHEMAGGLPLPAFAAPNVHLTSKRRREVCNPTGKSNIPRYKCGSKRTHLAQGRLLISLLRPLRKADP